MPLVLNTGKLVPTITPKDLWVVGLISMMASSFGAAYVCSFLTCWRHRVRILLKAACTALLFALLSRIALQTHDMSADLLEGAW